MKKNITALIFGILLFLGGGLYLDTLFFDWQINIFFNGWWTLFIIVPSFISILFNKPNWFNLSALFVGIILLLAAQDIIKYRDVWFCIIAAVVMCVGISLIIGAFRKPTPINQYNAAASSNGCDTNYQSSNFAGSCYEDGSSTPSYNGILSGVKSRNTSTNFEGAHISAVLGGAEIDLRDVIINKDVTVYCTAILGGVEVYAPKNIRINVVKTDILGSTECKAYTQPVDALVPIVTFNCTSVMGGVTIK